MDILASLHSTILPLHISAVSLTIFFVVCADLYALLWITGRKEYLDANILNKLHLIVTVGLALTIIAGLGLFLPYKSFLLTEPTFLTKMFLISCLIGNAFFIGKHATIAATHRFKDLTWSELFPLLLSGFVSTTGWIGALLAARFIPL